MSVFDFLAQLRSLDIQVTAENGRLKVNAPQGAVTPSIRDELNRRKAELISLLGNYDSVPLVSRAGPFSLSPAQEHLWQLQRLTPETVAYTMYAAFRLYGPLDQQAVQQAIQALVERHSTLRTCFPRTAGGVPQQVIAPASKILLQRVSLRPSPKLEEELHSFLEAEIRKPFDLYAGPLFRPTLIQIGPTEAILLLVVHHIVFDGHSFAILFRDLQRAYEASVAEKTVDWSPLPVEYIDYAAWLNEWLESEGGSSDRAYWMSQLSGDIPALELPIDHAYPLRPAPDGGFVDLPIQPALYTSLQELCRREGATLFAVALTAFNVLLHRASGQQDLLVCSPVAARDRGEFSDLIGYFNNTLLLRSRLMSTDTLCELLHRNQALIMGALGHQMFPFREVAAFPNLGRTSLSRGMVVVLESGESSLHLPGIAVEPIPVFSHAVQYDLSVEWTVLPEQLRGKLMYRSVLFDRNTIEYLAEEYLSILNELAGSAENKVGRNPVEGKNARQPLSNAIRPAYAPPRSDLERRLVRLWQEILGIEQVGIDDEFFELGGHSLLALRLFTRIEQETGTSLPLSTLFGTTTIASLARLIESEPNEEAWEIFVPIQPNGSKPPFFAIHGVEGGVLGYRDLALALGDDQPFLGLQAPGVDGCEDNVSTVEQMAVSYIRQMRTHQPNGPYRIGGYCFGGLVAYEMARQLEREGEQVSLLALFESSLPESGVVRATFVQRLKAVWNSLPAWISDYSGMTPRQLLNRLRSTIHKIGTKLWGNPEVERRLRVEETLDRIDVDSLPRQHIQLTGALMDAAVRYIPGEYNGKVTLFRARNRGINEVLFGSLDERMGWDRLAKGGVQVRLVEGFHRNMHLAPYAGSLAAELKKCLDEETVRE